METGRLPKIGETVERTKKGKEGSLSEYSSIDGKKVVKMERNQVYLTDWHSSLHYTHFTQDLTIGIIGKEGKARKPTHIIVYDLKDKDPIELAYSLPEAKETVKRLLRKEDVIEKSIVIYEIKKIIKPKLSVRFD